MHSRSFVLLLLFLSGGARRRVRIDDSRHAAQQQNNTLASSLVVVAETREALIPGDLGTGIFRRAGLRTGTSCEGFKQAGRRAGSNQSHHIAPRLRSGPRGAQVALQVAGAPKAAQMPSKGDLERKEVGLRAGRRALLIGTAALAGGSSADRALAWCGEAFPQWAYYLKWDENAVSFSWEGGVSKVRYRVVGDVARENRSGVPPILLVGNPGVGYDYLENFEALTVSDRRVIEVSFAGLGESAKPSTAQLWTVENCVAQLRAVCNALKTEVVHVVAHGLGAVPALRFAAERGSGGVRVRSLTLVSPWSALADLRPDARARFAAAPASQRASALLPTRSSAARDSCIAEALQPVQTDPLVYATAVSSLTDGAFARLINDTSDDMPVLLTSGGVNDIVDPEAWGELPLRVSRAVFPASGHLSFVDERDPFLNRVVDFMDEADGRTTNRELKFADPVDTFRELTARN